MQPANSTTTQGFVSMNNSTTPQHLSATKPSHTAHPDFLFVNHPYSGAQRAKQVEVPGTTNAWQDFQQGLKHSKVHDDAEARQAMYTTAQEDAAAKAVTSGRQRPKARTKQTQRGTVDHKAQTLRRYNDFSAARQQLNVAKRYKRKKRQATRATYRNITTGERKKSTLPNVTRRLGVVYDKGEIVAEGLGMERYS